MIIGILVVVCWQLFITSLSWNFFLKRISTQAEYTTLSAAVRLKSSSHTFSCKVVRFNKSLRSQYLHRASDRQQHGKSLQSTRTQRQKRFVGHIIVIYQQDLFVYLTRIAFEARSTRKGPSCKSDRIVTAVLSTKCLKYINTFLKRRNYG